MLHLVEFVLYNLYYPFSQNKIRVKYNEKLVLFCTYCTLLLMPTEDPNALKRQEGLCRAEVLTAHRVPQPKLT